MSNTINYNKSINVRHEVDVFVAGGGPAGVAAAVTAARLGKSVFLAEATCSLGGMGTAGLIPAFMKFTDGENFLAGGIGKEIYDKNNELGGVGTAINAEVLKKIYDDLCIDSGVNFTFQTQLIDVIMNGANIDYVILASKSGLFSVKAKMYIDGTGDGDLAYLSGAKYEKGDESGNMMPGTLCSLWSDVDWSRVDIPTQEGNLELAFKDKVFTYNDRHLPGMWKVGEKIGGGNIGHAFSVDGTDEVSLTKALVEQRKRLSEYETYYKNYLTGFENMHLVGTGSLLGIRETRRIIGDYVLNLSDFNNRSIFVDEIGRYSYPVDIHASTPDEENYKVYANDFKEIRYQKGESYGVPYRILTPVGLDNLLVAGRCVSTDRYMQGSIRVMPGCYITGQAAGVAASVSISNNTTTRGFDIRILQNELENLGGYLPNFR